MFELADGAFGHNLESLLAKAMEGDCEEGGVTLPSRQLMKNTDKTPPKDLAVARKL